MQSRSKAYGGSYLYKATVRRKVAFTLASQQKDIKRKLLLQIRVSTGR